MGGKEKPLIVWDVDDVLNPLMRCWFDKFWRVRHPKCGVRYDGLVENPPQKILGVRREEYLASLDAFRLSGAYARMRPNREILEWFQKDGRRFRHAVLTAAPVSTVFVSAEWVLRHFGRWIRSFHFVPSRRKGEGLLVDRKTKGEMLAGFGRVAAFVDDSPIHVAAARRAGIQAFLMPQPWNSSPLTVGQMLKQLTKLNKCA